MVASTSMLQAIIRLFLEFIHDLSIFLQSSRHEISQLYQFICYLFVHFKSFLYFSCSFLSKNFQGIRQF